ncbi:hypothetical protein [Adhaeretor mobilis]|uniref:Transmembrane protein n=1 Tax=Adhaeretor mobilis TaxID=1930276 RepID=A0A517MR12_9BACT|nr:hypothetical protein [Adhaeretor mobilis]QDS97323.1 hypothetical protein HG15A2_05840 [Adhaeretor mobilis]
MSMNENRPPWWVALIFGAVGSAMMLVAVGAIPLLEEDFQEDPAWLLFVCGILFAAAGVSLVLPTEPRWLRLIVVASVPLCMSILGAWAACSYDARLDDEGFQLPFVSEETNTTIGRVIFGMGAVFCLWLTTMALRGKGHVVGDQGDEDPSN